MGESRKNREIPADLLRVAARFARWRHRRELGTRIPESLWRQCVVLAARHGLSRTATTLGLDYYALRKRIEARSSATARGPSPRPVFVELAASPPAASSPATSRENVSPLATPGRCLIKCTNATGATLCIYLKGHEVPDLVALGRSFWNAE
jgi:hypothetical protein